jgi:large subunit ribosomal protein L28
MTLSAFANYTPPFCPLLKTTPHPGIYACDQTANNVISRLFYRIYMARICELTGKRPMKGSIIWRSGKSKKSGGIGTHVTAITKRRFMPNLQRVKAVINGEVRYVRVATSAIKKGLITKAPKRKWKKEDVAKAA